MTANLQIVCPHCDVKLYTFVRDRQVAREDHALDLAAQIHATEDGVSTVVGTFGPSGIISSKVVTPTNKRNKP